MQRCARNWNKCIAVALVLALVMLLVSPLTAVAEDTMGEDSVFISIRRYDGIDPDDMVEAERIIRDGFVPIVSGSAGFIAYYVVFTDDDVLLTINLFETREQAMTSNDLAREFVVDYLAPLLPNLPLIVEGSVDIGFVEMLHGMDDSDVSSLFASVRIYDGFETANLDKFVSIVEDGLLPLMRETDGFLGYYLMDNGAGKVASVSIFDSEESALASNEKARDFAAEKLTVYLPNDPLVSAGRVGIAVLANVNDGANLIDDMMMVQAVFVSIRVYDGVDPMDRDEIVRIVDEGFLQIMRESDGFVGYYLLPAGDKLVAISLFDSAEKASDSTAAARDLVADYMAPLLPNPPHVVEGLVDIMYVAGADEMMLDGMTTLYGALRIYDNYDMSYLEEANRLVESILLPAQQEAGRLVQLLLH